MLKYFFKLSVTNNFKTKKTKTKKKTKKSKKQIKKTTEKKTTLKTLSSYIQGFCWINFRYFILYFINNHMTS